MSNNDAQTGRDESPAVPDAGVRSTDEPSQELEERRAAWKRGQERAKARGTDAEPQHHGVPPGALSALAPQAFAALADNVRDYAIFLLDKHGTITFWGNGARMMKWWTRDEAEGANLRLLYMPNGSTDGTAEEHIKEAIERGEYTGEGERVRSDGSTFWAGVTLTALRDADGELLGFAKVTRDLTARRAADTLLHSAAVAADEARRSAEQASIAKSGFMATMSHEIRTPINAVMGYLDLLDIGTDGPLNEAQRKHVRRAGLSARHLLELVSDVLDFSELEAEREAPEPSRALGEGTFRVGDAVTAALQLVTPQAHARRIEIVNAVGGYAGGVSASGDEGRARQILVNLLANAIKFTDQRDADDGRITISAGTAAQASPDARLGHDGPWVYIRVEDTGIGIPADRLQPVFEPFVQADMGLTRQRGGTGLGLAISRRLARLMGGDVTVRSTVGVGSTFFLWLPAAPLESLQTGGVEGHGPGAESKVPLETLHNAGTTDRAAHAMPVAGGPMRAVSDAVLAELERILHAYVARLRSDPATPGAHDVNAAEIEDHLATFLGDLASTLRHLDAAATGQEGEQAAIDDSTAIQRVVAERHGVSRGRLGWSDGEVRREFTILREELVAAVLRQAPARIVTRGGENREAELANAIETLSHFLASAERISIERCAATREGGKGR